MSPAGASLVIGVAVAVPGPLAEQIAAVRDAAGQRDTGIPIHLTLLPPTTVDAVLGPEVREHLAAVASAHRPFPVALDGTDTFRPVSPVAFVRVVAGEPALGALEAGVRSDVLSRPIAFPYHPHITIAHDVAPAALDAAQDALAGFKARFVVESFRLYEHVGGRWEPREDFALAGTPR